MLLWSMQEQKGCQYLLDLPSCCTVIDYGTSTLTTQRRLFILSHVYPPISQ
jgi:hypothetical protein